MRKQELLDRISLDPRIMAGQPCIRGTRLTVHHVLNVLAFGTSVEEILQEYDGLSRDDVAACLLFASEALANTAFVPLAASATQMQFTVDECLGPKVAQWLRDEGYDAISIFDATRGSVDEDILAWAVREDRVLVTADKDFGDLVFRDRHAHRGVMLLRLDDETSENVIRVPSELLREHADEIDHHFVVVTETGFRVHRGTGGF